LNSWNEPLPQTLALEGLIRWLLSGYGVAIGAVQRDDEPRAPLAEDGLRRW
jgi:hypothetical protein